MRSGLRLRCLCWRCCGRGQPWWLTSLSAWLHRLLHDDLKESGLLPVLARLVKAFNYRHQPRRHAADLVSAVHVVLRMLHHLNSSGAYGLLLNYRRVQRKEQVAYGGSSGQQHWTL